MLSHFGFVCEMPGIGNCLDTSDGGPPSTTYLVPWFLAASRSESLDDNWPLVLNDSAQVGKREMKSYLLRNYLEFIHDKGTEGFI